MADFHCDLLIHEWFEAPRELPLSSADRRFIFKDF
jgi:hypothetical protein